MYAGKAHPADEPGKALIHHVIETAGKLSNDMLRIVYLENYAWDLGALLTAGVDVWVNTPRRPYEASGHQRHESSAEWRAEPVDPRRMVD